MSKRGSKKTPVPAESSSRTRLSKKYQDSSSNDDDDDDDDDNGGQNDDIRDWIVDDTGFGHDDSDDDKHSNTQLPDNKILQLMAKHKSAASSKSGAFEDFDSNDMDSFFSTKKDKTSSISDFLDFSEFDSGATYDSSTSTGDAGLADNFDEYFQQTPIGFGSIPKTGTGFISRTKADVFGGNAMIETTIAPDDYGYNDSLQDDFPINDDYGSSPIDDIAVPAPQVEQTTKTTTTAKKTMTGEEEKTKREFDQKRGIAVMGKITEKEIIYEHETAAASALTSTSTVEEAEKQLKEADLIIDAADLGKYSNHYIYVYSLYEDKDVRDGRLYLFGRLLLNDIESNPNETLTTSKLQTKSICIVVQCVERSMFVLPRKHPLERGKVLTDRTVQMEDVKAEIEELLENRGIEGRRTRTLSRKYCFSRRVTPNAFVQPGEKSLKKNIQKAKRQAGENDPDNDDELDDLNAEEDDEGEKKEEDMGDSNDDDAKVASSKSSSDFYRDESLLDPINGIPREARYLHVLYPSTYPALSQELKGKTFSHIFGTQTSRQELFIVDRKLKGPCWVQIPTKNARNESTLKPKASLSWCDFEIDLERVNQLNVVVDREIPPPYFTSISLSIKTAVRLTVNNTYEKQIVMATLKTDYFNNIELSKTKQQQLAAFENTWTIIAPPNDTRMPYDWEEKRQAFNKRHANRKAELHVAPTEAKLLQILLHMLHQRSPDIIIGHDLHGSVIDVLISRFHAHKLGQQWSKFGRLKRANIPKHGVGTSRSLVENGVGAGRLLVDTQLMAREFYPAKQYSLDYLTEQLLGANIKTVDALQVHDHFINSKALEDLMNINIFDAEFQSRLMHNLDIIPLTKQLTNLCGNTWHSSLRSSRAERVEYLLLHTFLLQDYLPPEPPVHMRPTPFNTTDLDEFGYDTNDSNSNANIRRGGESKSGNNKNNRKSTQKKRVTMMLDDDDNEQQFFDENTLVDSDDEENKDRQDKNNAQQDSANGNNGGGDGSSSNSSTPGALKKKVGYAGGKVLEPKRGFYNDWIAVLDFNSLYPSIIREYNLCFTTTEHWTIDIDVPNPNFDSFLPPINAPVGILPNVVRMLIDRRRNVRKALATATSDNEKQMLHIKQLAFKLVANSLYGCLGFASSRFYCRPIAACVTSKGRQALDNAVSIAASFNAQIVYGDTDSIMVNTQMQTYKDARAVAVRLKNGINKQYKVLNIDEDGYFKNMLLLRKKKYAAMKLERVEPYDEKSFAQLQRELAARPDGYKYNPVAMPNLVLEGKDISIDDPVLRENKDCMNTFIFKREVKGLDMVRRDWSELCRKASSDILDAVLRCDTTSRDQVVAKITDLLSYINQLMTTNELDITHYVITKQLTRSLEQYQDVKKLPHVYVAWKASQRGKIVRANDVVEYVMTTSDSNASNATQSDRAVSKEDYINYTKHMANEHKLCENDPTRKITPYFDYPTDMKLDLIYYKETQLLTPIMRLIDVLDEISTAKIAECIGLDSAKYALRERRDGNGGGQYGDIELESKLTGEAPADKYRDLPPFYISCPRCDVAFPFVGVYTYFPLARVDAYRSAPQPQRDKFNFWTLPFQMHSNGYFTKLNQCSFNKTGFVCPTPNCPGLFDYGQMDVHQDPRYSTTLDSATLSNYLCNAVEVAIRDYILQFEQLQFIYNSKDLHNTIVTYGPNGMLLNNDQYLSTELMSKGIEPQKAIHQLDVLNYITYLEHLFDYPTHRKLLQHECDARINRNYGKGNHSKSLVALHDIKTNNVNHHNNNNNNNNTSSGAPSTESSSFENSKKFYQALQANTMAEIDQAIKGEFDEAFTPCASTVWTRDEGEKELSNLDSTISPEILIVFANVQKFIKQHFLRRNRYSQISLASIFGGFRSELLNE